MSNNIEIVMDIETLEVFEVIDLDEEKEVMDRSTELITSPVDVVASPEPQKNSLGRESSLKRYDR